MSQQKVFYTITTMFIAYFALFIFVLYPHPEYFHPSEETITNLSASYPNLKWFIRISGHWSYATFYAMAELWGSMMVSLLFWQFANQITKTSEAKRFYSMFGLLGNFALPLVAVVLTVCLDKELKLVPEEYGFTAVVSVIIFSGLMVMGLYSWINSNVLTDPRLYDPESVGSPKKKKAKLSLGDSFKMIMTSKYLGLILILIIAYGVSINLVEGVWKAKIKEIYTTKEDYTRFMANFQGYQGATAILFMLIGSNILRKVSWETAASFTPVMILITGLAFFSFIIFDSTVGLYVSALIGTGPIAVAVLIGTIQNILSKATKYSLFDSTKEMSYIPLDDEMKSKGKAAVDVIGGRFGKSGGGIIQSTFFMLMPTLTFDEATPYFATIFIVIMIAWLYAVRVLGKEYREKLAEVETLKQ